MILHRLRDAVTEVDDFGDRWIRDLVGWPARWWPGDPMDRPRVHVCGLWGECRSDGAPPNISFMGWRHNVVLWLSPIRVRHHSR